MGVGRLALGMVALAACAAPSSGGRGPSGAHGDLAATGRTDLDGGDDGGAPGDLAATEPDDGAASVDLEPCVSPPHSVTCMGSCGMVVDPCGATVDCGTSQCVAPYTCGGGGAPNLCGCVNCGCIDNHTACSGMTCGMAVNNCGQPVSCGTCPMGTRCCSGSFCVPFHFVCPL
jgi:hypothetical protein